MSKYQERIKALREQGLSVTQIVERLRCGKTIVYRAMRGEKKKYNNSPTRKQIAERAAMCRKEREERCVLGERVTYHHPEF